MDIKLTQRGKILLNNGELPILNSDKEELNSYFNAAILNTIKDTDLKILGRVSDVTDPTQSGTIQTQLNQLIVDAIINSPFSEDFSPELISVVSEHITDEQYSIKISYGSGASAISLNFNVEGGDIVLKEDAEDLAEMDSTTEVITMDIVITENTNYVKIPCDAFSVIAITESGSIPKYKAISIDTSTITNRILVGQDFSNPNNISIGQIANDTATIYIVDSIYLRQLFPSLNNNDIVLNINDINNSLSSIDYVKEADDYLLTVSSNPVNLEIFYVTGISKGKSVEQTTEKSSSVSRVPFPNDIHYGPKLVLLDKVIEPGVYTIVYIGLVKEEYNSALLRR